jgi:hypothetical protein
LFKLRVAGVLRHLLPETDAMHQGILSRMPQKCLLRQTMPLYFVLLPNWFLALLLSQAMP